MEDPVRSLPVRRMPVNCAVPVLAFVGTSGSGKTTLIEALLPRLAGAGLRVAVVKHAHAATEFDRPRKDSYRAADAGAVQVAVASRAGYAVFERTPDAVEPPSLEWLVSRLDLGRVDLVLAEGFHFERVPKIEVFREACGRAMICEGDPDVVAVAGAPGSRAAGPVAVLDLDDAEVIAGFILRLYDGMMAGRQETARLRGTA